MKIILLLTKILMEKSYIHVIRNKIHLCSLSNNPNIIKWNSIVKNDSKR